MAAGDLTLFEQLSAEISNIHDLDADTIKIALITAAVAPTAADATATPFSTYTQIAGTGGYTTGGTDISATFVEAGGTGTFDGTNVTWSKNASSPTNARYAIIYNDTAASDNSIAFIDLGATIDMTAGDLTINFNASGIFTLA